MGAFGDGFYVDLLFAVPIFDRADTYGAGDTEDIISVAEGKERVVGIPMTLGEFELRLAIAIGIDRLFLIEIDTICHEFGLNRYTMVMERMIRVVLADIIRHRVGPFGDGIAMTDFSAFGEDGVAGTYRVRGCTNLPKGSRYPRLASRE